ncbi:hypothetical protein GF420_14880 [candidate division GN15 bacterium]|nr:hypothetical protein [candidate division GN15 bacterium]
MNSLRILLALLLCSIAAQAADTPIDRNSVLVDGIFTITMHGGDAYPGDTYATFDIVSSVGMFPVDHLFVGVNLSFFQASEPSISENVLVGPTIGYYFSFGSGEHDSGSFYPYVRAFYMVGSVSEYLGDSQSQFGARLGSVAMLSRSIGLDIMIQYSREEISGYKWAGGSGPFDPYYEDDVSGATLLFGAGITGFIF